MLTYDGRASYLLIFLCMTGSVVPKAAAWGLDHDLGIINPRRLRRIESGNVRRSLADSQLSAGLDYVRGDLFSQPYSHYIISYMLGFLMIFRGSSPTAVLGWPQSSTYESLNRLNCAAGMVVAFDELAQDKNAMITGDKWRRHMMHLFSLLAGTQLLEIRFSDLELSELSPLHRVLTTRPKQGQMKLNERVLKKLIPPVNAPSAATDALSPARAAMMDRYPIEILDGVAEHEKSHLEMHAPTYDQAVNARIVRLISKRFKEGGVAMHEAIVSRIYQEIALGNSAFKQALKIARVRFPFPYAQLLEVVKLFVICVTPFVVLSKTDTATHPAQAWLNTLWSMFHAFFVAFNFVAMTKVAQEMEDPFGVDSNDLPLLSMHDELNFRLEKLTSEKPPAVDFHYNPGSKYSMKGRDAMFSAMGDSQRSAATTATPSSSSYSTTNAGSNLTVSLIRRTAEPHPTDAAIRWLARLGAILECVERLAKPRGQAVGEGVEGSAAPARQGEAAAGLTECYLLCNLFLRMCVHVSSR